MPKGVTESTVEDAALPWFEGMGCSILKSRFLAQAGFDQSNPDALIAAIRALAIGAEGSEDGSNEYGTIYRLEGSLVGPGWQSPAVVTVWIRWHADGNNWAG